MKRLIFLSLITSSGLATMLVACNAILDNQPGALAVREAGTAPTTDASPPQGKVPDAPDADAAATAPDASAPAPCAAGEHVCFDRCVLVSDPGFGCGDPSCSPCGSAHGRVACEGRTCIMAQCNPGRADCNATATDGCETDLSTAASCGNCNAPCAAATPLCAPSGPTFQCTNGCPPAAPLKCGADCVDPLTSANHCGGCGLPCPVVANATSSCVAGACTFTCNATFHVCAGKCLSPTDPAGCGPACTACPVPAGGAATCVANVCGVSCTAPSHACAGKCVAPTDPTACGPTCLLCPVPPNVSATCAADACGFTCSAGFGNCDALAANGCEATLANNPLHCGACGKACNGMPCVAGVCLVVPLP